MALREDDVKPNASLNESFPINRKNALAIQQQAGLYRRNKKIKKGGGNLLGEIDLPVLAVGGLGGVHLVDTNDELLYSKGVGQQSVLSGLSVLGDTGLELSGT